MKFNKIYIPFILLVMILSQSCNKYLDHEPDNRTDINSLEKVKQLIVSAYPKNEYYVFTESASDNAEDLGQGPIVSVFSQPYNWQDNLGGGGGSPIGYWNGAYNGIAAANQALEAIDKLGTDKASLPYKGEALVARAYAHFMLVTFFAKAYQIGGANETLGIPYVKEPETTVIKQYDRGTVKSTYDDIEKDLTEGMALLAGSTHAIPKFHFTPEAAHAFAARFYLFKGEWQKVIDHVNLLAGNNSLVARLRPINTIFKNLATTEYRLLYTKSELAANILLATQSSSYAYYTASNYGGTYNQRYGVGIKLTRMFNSSGNYSGKALANKIFGSVPFFMLNKFQPSFIRDVPYVPEGSPYVTSPLFTIDEALMNRAEAYVHLGQLNNAIKDVTDFMSVRIDNYNQATDAPTVNRAKTFYSITDDKEAVIKLILESKKAEFLTEGIRWLDIIRHRITVRHNIIAANGQESFIELGPNDNRRVFQIPQISVMAGLPLNPR